MQDDDLLRRVRHVVVTADDVRDRVLRVLERRREVVRRAAVRTYEHNVLESLVRELDPALDGVLPSGRALVRHADPDRAFVLVRLAFTDEAPRRLAAGFHDVELERGRTVPVDAQ